MRSIWRACGLVPTWVPLAFGAACGEPDLASDLRPQGAPEVVEVNIRSEAILLSNGGPTGLQGDEGATFCRSGEEYKLNFAYCPEARDENDAPIPGERDVAPLMDAVPKGWRVRIVFDELLDPAVEDLRRDDSGTRGHIDRTQPVVLRCAGDEVPYDGWYEPSGSHLTYPPSPALVVVPSQYVATGTTDCEITVVDTVVDKDGETVPSGQVGPYTFGIAPLVVYGSLPANGAQGVVLDASIRVEFNAPIDLSTVDGRFVVSAGAGGAAVPGTFDYVEEGGRVDESVVAFEPDDDLAPNTRYTITVSGAIADIEGGTAPGGIPAYSATFTTGAAE